MEKTTFGKQKKFSKALHAAHDPKSREVVKEYYKDKLGIILEDNKSRYGVDLISKCGKYSVEVEHRLAWKSVEFDYELVNIAERKKKFLLDGKTDYVILSKNYSRIGIIKGKIVSKYMGDEHLKESSNKFVKYGEYFYKVPREKFDFFDIN